MGIIIAIIALAISWVLYLIELRENENDYIYRAADDGWQYQNADEDYAEDIAYLYYDNFSARLLASKILLAISVIAFVVGV